MKAHRLLRRIIIVMLPFVCVLSAWEWPANVPRLLNSFAEVVDEDYLRGVRIVHPPDGNVQSANNGIILLSHSSSPTPITPPHPLGSFILVEHLDKTRTLYTNLDNLYRTSGVVLRGTPIGQGTGTQEQAKEFEFRILDVVDGGYINPLLILPHPPDLLSPTVRNISVSRTNNAIRGEHIIVEVNAIDRLRIGNPLLIMPYYWSIEYAGEEYGIILDVFRENDGHLILLSSGRRIEDSIPQLWRTHLGILPYVDGQRRLRVIVGDHIGRYSIRTASIETPTE